MIAEEWEPWIVSIIFKFFLLYSVEHNKKNWLFSVCPKRVASSTIAYTIVERAKANNLNVYKYLAYLLSQRTNEKMSDEQLAPWSETVKLNCQN